MPRTARGTTVSTIGDLIDGDYCLSVYCNDIRCFHHVELDLTVLAERLGRAHGCMHRDLAHKFVCSKCGGRNIALQGTPRKTGPRW